ncbi:MAG: alpha/beta hydrolase [Erysipelotrichaceae bacterium]|nr:alpha/beta hydrolase [Erysipelotrichaceae bacterium]
MQTVIEGIRLSFDKKGKKGRSVLLMHGWGQNKEMMDFIAEHLSAHFTVYNFDLPGFGESDEPNDAWGSFEYAEFIHKFCEKKKIEDPIIIAHSFGCRIALQYAYRYKVHKMCLTGAAGVRDSRGINYYFKVYSYKAGKKIMSLKPLEKYKEKFMKNAGSADYQNTSGVMRSTFVKIVNEDLKPLLNEIDTETLLVFGENDEATPVAKGKLMEKLMSNAALVVFENDDHFAYFHQAQRFNMVLDAFLGGDYQ